MRLMEEQLEVSHILVNKTDLISEDKQQQLKDELNLINAQVPIILTSYGKVNIDEISQFRRCRNDTHTFTSSWYK